MRVSGPGPIFVQLLRMLYVTPRTAKVAMPGRPRQAHERDTDEQSKDAPGHRGNDERSGVADRVLAEERKQPRVIVGLSSTGMVMTPAAKAPTATKLTCPNEITPELPTKT